MKSNKEKIKRHKDYDNLTSAKNAKVPNEISSKKHYNEMRAWIGWTYRLYFNIFFSLVPYQQVSV